jgi:hypothetical protein
LPVGNTLRSFLQLSNFTETKIAGEPETRFSFTENINVVKKVIIWNIDNLENLQDSFNGSVGLYNVVPGPLTNTSTFKDGTITQLSVGTNYTGPLEELRFFATPASEVVNLIKEVSEPLQDIKNIKCAFLINRKIVKTAIGRDIESALTHYEMDVLQNHVCFFLKVVCWAQSQNGVCQQTL